MNFLRSFSTLAVAVAALSVQQAHAWTYTGTGAQGTCANLDSTGTAADFQITAVASKAKGNASDVLKMAFVLDSATARSNANAKADVIFIERFGNVKYYWASKDSVALIGTIPGVATGVEDGLIGVTVERAFKNRVYVVYSHNGTGCVSTAPCGSYRLSRFDMDATTHQLNLGSEKVLLDVPSYRSRWHTSGALNMDLYGNLFWDVGDNQSILTGPANSHDLRGKILRIHPNDDGNGYTIPKGNFAETESTYFAGIGHAALASKYMDTSKVRPEIYVMGTRNTYTAAIDPFGRQLVYSQCGPDYGGTTELHSNTLKANFAGWPYFAGITNVASSQVSNYSANGNSGANEVTAAQWSTYLSTNRNAVTNTWTSYTSATPGIDTLPPVDSAKFSYTHQCAMGGAIIHYDGRVANPNKLPPQMDNVWILGDYNSRYVMAVKTDANGNPIPKASSYTFGGTRRIFQALQSTTSAATIEALLDIQQGPDGALYVVNNNCSGGTGSGGTHYSDGCSGIARIEYKGASCSDPTLYPTANGQSIPTAIVQAEKDRLSSHGILYSSLGGRLVWPEGMRVAEAYDLQGKLVWSYKREATEAVTQLPAKLKSDVLRLRFQP